MTISATGMGIGQPPVKMSPMEVDCLIQLIFQLREATKKTEATEKMTLCCLCVLLFKILWR